MNIIIVDDEMIEVYWIVHNYEFRTWGIDKVLTAFNIMEAKNILDTEAVDIMLCDIEMPGGSGIELMTWVRQWNSEMQCIFLTCHADFAYASAVIKLGCVDYILKPTTKEMLDRVMSVAVRRLEENVNMRQMSRLWMTHKPLVMKNFWSDLIYGNISCEVSEIQKHAESMGFPGLETMHILPVFVSLRKNTAFMEPDEHVLAGYSVNNILREILLSPADRGVIIEYEHHWVVLCFESENRENDVTDVYSKCHQIIQSFKSVISYCLCIYIGEFTKPSGLPGMVKELHLLNSSNVCPTNSVTGLGTKKFQWSIRDTDDIKIIFKLAQRGQLQEAADKVKLLLERPDIRYHSSLDTLRELHHELMKSVLAYIQYRHIEPVKNDSQVYGRLYAEVDSIEKLKRWFLDMVQLLSDDAGNEAVDDVLTESICGYIREHISEKLSREELASVAGLNPDYMARIFKRSTGMIISDYIAAQRVDLAKKLLAETNISLIQIAEDVGFSEYPYFSLTFKKITGMTPRAYRCGNQTKSSQR